MTWRPHLTVSFYDLKDSLWYRPALMTVAALILSFVTVQLDHYLFSRQQIQLPWLFQGGTEGARGVLTVIAGTMITVATTAFSVTLVALQLGSSQFSPRILRSFTGDPGNQMVLGTFIATFAYSISVLRTIRSRTEDFEGFVPTISVTVAVLMTFTAIGSLIFFFHHATRTIQASVIIDRTYNDARKLIERTHTRQTAGNRRLLQESISLPDRFERLAIIKGERAGYLRDPDFATAVSIAHTNSLLLELHVGVGNYLNPGIPVVTIWRDIADREAETDDGGSIVAAIRGCFDFGLERTLEFDSLFGMQQLTDISLLALSPGTNDPTTAHAVIDRIGTTLIDVERICGANVVCADDVGTIRLFYPIPTFEDFARLPFDQIRYYGAADPLLVAHILATLHQVARQLAPENANVVKDIATEIVDGADRSRWVEADTQRVMSAATWAQHHEVPPRSSILADHPGNAE